MIEAGRSRDGHPIWTAERTGAARAIFVGRGPTGAQPIPEVLQRLVADAPPAAWLRQVHSARVREARPGACGEGDGLVSNGADCAAAIATADCVPVLLAAPGAVAAAHAGWRGLAAGILTSTVERLGAQAVTLTAWLGPAIGPCCYEVGEDVAVRVAEACGAAARFESAGRPRLDLHAACRGQLAASGVTAVHAVSVCTRCAPDLLHSYRRDGRGAGRNLAFVWVEEPA